MSFSYNKLRGRIVEKYGSQSKFADKIGISNVSMTKKMTCKTGFSQEDIELWALELGIDRSEYAEYFFA